MTRELAGYSERAYRLYGHRVTRRRNIIEWCETVGVSVALAIASLVSLLEKPEGALLWLIPAGVFISSMCYRVHKMNVNGFEYENNKEVMQTQLFPWKFK